MAWQFQLNQTHQAPASLAKIENVLDGLGQIAGLSAKIGAADAKDDMARYVVFWNEDLQAQGIPRCPHGPWAKQTWSTVNDFDDRCQEIAQKLNELQSSNPGAAFFAKLAYTDSKYHAGHFALYYPVG